MNTAICIEHLTTTAANARPFGTTDKARKYCARTLKRECDGVDYSNKRIAPFFMFNGIPHFPAIAAN